MIDGVYILNKLLIGLQVKSVKSTPPSTYIALYIIEKPEAFYY